MCKSRVTLKRLVRILYKVFGAAVACEIETKWKGLQGHGHIAEHMLFDLGGTATSASSYKKQFGRWKAWYLPQSSFASSDERMLGDVLRWCKEQRVITAAERTELHALMLALLKFSAGTLTIADLARAVDGMLPCVSSFTKVQRVVGTKSMFLDMQENMKFRTSQLEKLAPRTVRLDKNGKRGKVIEAAAVAIETVEKIARILESELRAAEHWKMPPKEAAKLNMIARRAAEQVSVALRQTALPKAQIQAQADALFASVSKQMRDHFKILQSSD